jgi:hypothetical protein
MLKKKSEKEEKMDVDEKPAAVEKEGDNAAGTATEGEKDKADKKEKEPDFEM